LKTGKSNKELLKQIKAGNMVAFYNIYEKYSKRLFGFVLRYIKQEEDAEEIVQEVFVKVWENRDRIDIYSSFDAYLFTIAYNTTMSLFRKRVHEKKYLEHLKSIQQIGSTEDITDEMHFRELSEKVQALLDELTPRQKEIFQLSREEGLTHEEIAKRLGISVNTVKKHMVNTLSFLRTHLANDLIAGLLIVHLFF
jgi:RNA polymerase sigma-70 factor (ECF subfamily)